MAHDDQFTATGPAFTGAGFPRAAFSTGRLGTDSTYGVNVQGSLCGVYGESASSPSSRQVPEPNTGVCGVGDEYGVFGSGFREAGVQGETQNFSAVGVAALSKDGRAAADPQAIGWGAVAATESFRGFGMVGLSMDSHALTALRAVPRPARDSQTGRVNLQGLRLGGGTGVLGAAGIFPRGPLGTSTGVVGTGGTGVVGVGHWAGVEANSDSGHAVIGTTRAGVGVEGSSELLAGVVGKSISGVGGFFTSFDKEALVGRSGGPGDGVRGQADSGIGVRGEAGSGIGVFGRSAAQAGVLGRSASAAGVFGFADAAFKLPGPSAGVLGVNDKSVGVLGSSVGAIGVWGNTAKGLAVLGTTDFGADLPADPITDQGIGVTGLANEGVGIAGRSTAGTGVFGSSATGLAGHFKGPVLIEGALMIVGGPKSAAVPHPDGSHRQLYCVESPESWFEDFGQAQLVDGEAEVPLDACFAAVVALDAYQVFLSPYGDTNGLFVAERTASGFRVCEQQGGKSNVCFGYRVVAKRKDVCAERMARVTIPEASGKAQLPDLRLELNLEDLERWSAEPIVVADPSPAAQT